MLFVAKGDGRVLRFDLTNPEDFRGWIVQSAEASFHASISSVSLSENGNRADLPMPRRFAEVRYEAEVVHGAEGEVIAERISAYTELVVVSLTMYRNGGSGRFRVDMDKRGRRRFQPHKDP